MRKWEVIFERALNVFVYPACPVKFFAEDERSGFNRGSSGRWYWGDFVAELFQKALIYDNFR
jgi:hypothetical protein